MKRFIFPFTLLFSLVLVMTYPLVFRIGHFIPGFYSTDETYAILWDYWRIKYCFLHAASLLQTNLISYPYGVDLYSSAYISYLQQGVIHLLSLISTPVLTYNIQVIFNFFLSSVFTYILVFYLTRSRLSAFFSSIIFAFCPYQFNRAWQHLGLTYNQWLPLCLFTAILLKEKGSKKEFLFFLLSLLLLLSFDFSVMYFGAVSLAVFIIYIVFSGWRGGSLVNKVLLKEKLKFTKKIVAAGLIAILILLPQFFPIIKNRLKISPNTSASAFNAYNRPFEDLFTQSAKPLSYFLPSLSHPLFGGFTEQFIGSPLYGISLTEHSLYLGWVPILFAFYAFRRWRAKRKELNQASLAIPAGTFSKRDNFNIGFFVFLFITAWLFSQSPWWGFGKLKIYMPSFIMYKILPMYRAYCRFGILVMLATAILAGFGLKFFLEKFKSRISRIFITVLFSGLVLFEFLNWPPYKVIDVSGAPAVYTWLKEQPQDTIIAEYPLDADSSNELYKFYQTKHQKRMINGTVPGTKANKFAQKIINLSNPRTSGILKWMGVRYVIVHIDGYKNTEQVGAVEELSKISKNPGLRLIGHFTAQECPEKKVMCTQGSGPVDLYEVVSSPVNPQN